MLKIRIHHSENCGIGIMPTVKNGSGEAPLSLAHQQADARIFMGDCQNHIPSAIAAVVIYHEDFVWNPNWIEHGSNAVQQAANVFRFAKCWNYERQFFLS